MCCEKNNNVVCTNNIYSSFFIQERFDVVFNLSEKNRDYSEGL